MDQPNREIETTEKPGLWYSGRHRFSDDKQTQQRGLGICCNFTLEARYFYSILRNRLGLAYLQEHSDIYLEKYTSILIGTVSGHDMVPTGTLALWTMIKSRLWSWTLDMWLSNLTCGFSLKIRYYSIGEPGPSGQFVCCKPSSTHSYVLLPTFRMS